MDLKEEKELLDLMTDMIKSIIRKKNMPQKKQKQIKVVVSGGFDVLF